MQSLIVELLPCLAVLHDYLPVPHRGLNEKEHTSDIYIRRQHTSAYLSYIHTQLTLDAACGEVAPCSNFSLALLRVQLALSFIGRDLLYRLSLRRNEHLFVSSALFIEAFSLSFFRRCFLYFSVISFLVSQRWFCVHPGSFIPPLNRVPHSPHDRSSICYP